MPLNNNPILTYIKLNKKYFYTHICCKKIDGKSAKKLRLVTNLVMDGWKAKANEENKKRIYDPCQEWTTV